MVPTARELEPAATSKPPSFTNFLRFSFAVAPPPGPDVTSQRLRRSGSFDASADAPPRPPPAAPPPPPRPPRPPPAAPPTFVPDGTTITSYFDLRFGSSKPAPHTTVNGNSKRSRM